MFNGAKSFNQDLSRWKVEKCKRMDYMFLEAKKFNRDSVKNCDLSGKQTKYMFKDMEAGEKMMKPHVEALRKWEEEGKFRNGDLRLAVKEWRMDSSAAEAKYGHIYGCNTSEVTDMGGLFWSVERGAGEAAKHFNDDISRWKVGWVKDMVGMFNEAESFNQDLSGWNAEKCTGMVVMFYGAKKFNKDSVKNWDLSGKDTRNMFKPGENGEKMTE